MNVTRPVHAFLNVDSDGNNEKDFPEAELINNKTKHREPSAEGSRVEIPNKLRVLVVPKKNVGDYICHICENMLEEPYNDGVEIVGNIGNVGNINRRKSAVLKLVCGDSFHLGCLLDHFRTLETIANINNLPHGVTVTGTVEKEQGTDETEQGTVETQQGRLLNNKSEDSLNNKPEDIVTIYESITCPAPDCEQLSIPRELEYKIVSFIGEEKDITTPLKEWRKIDNKAYTGFNPPCFGINCTTSGGKRKTKKVKKSKRTRKQTKKINKKLNKTKRKNSKK